MKGHQFEYGILELREIESQSLRFTEPCLPRSIWVSFWMVSIVGCYMMLSCSEATEPDLIIGHHVLVSFDKIISNEINLCSFLW